MKTKYFTIVIPILMIAFIGQMCTSTEKKVIFTSNPISAVGHGVMIDSNGEEIKPDSNFIEAAQDFYISNLMLKDKKNKNFLAKKQEELFNEVNNKILGNALFIDFLIEKVKPQNSAKLSTINNFMRLSYIKNILKKSILPNDLKKGWAKGFDAAIAQKLQGLDFNVFSSTVNSGQEYCDECMKAGVPIPKEMFSDEWKFQGIIDNVFISRDSQAELWFFESNSPKGVCLALPRYEIDSITKIPADSAGLFGVICLGTTTGKACFFDNPPGVKFKKNQKRDFKDWVGGSSLVKNQDAGGICTECHAGENPFIVHPNKLAFMNIKSKLKSPVWYDPIVDESWVQNPGPSKILDNIILTPDDESCLTCHTQKGAGRFPEISPQLEGYCKAVLKRALIDTVRMTMPPNKKDRLKYKTHIDALNGRCASFFTPQ